MPPNRLVYVDYDGTITDQDTFYTLAYDTAGKAAWQDIEDRLQSGALALRDVLTVQARMLRISLDDADAILAQRLQFDPTFAAFVGACEANDVALAILSSGVKPLIARALSRQGLGRVPVLASEVVVEPDGWVMQHRDDSANGHDKAAAVRAAQAAGQQVVYVGDGFSDYAAALLADVRFAKRGRSLQPYLLKRQVPFTAFDTFAEIEKVLFPH
jgi:2,3-diketo-5-methylthio-1-phosphopentane phosphatase